MPHGPRQAEVLAEQVGRPHRHGQDGGRIVAEAVEQGGDGGADRAVAAEGNHGLRAVARGQARRGVLGLHRDAPARPPHRPRDGRRHAGGPAAPGARVRQQPAVAALEADDAVGKFGRGGHGSSISAGRPGYCATYSAAAE